MAIKQIDENFCPYRKAYVKEYICDTDADFANLPFTGVVNLRLSLYQAV